VHLTQEFIAEHRWRRWW